MVNGLPLVSVGAGEGVGLSLELGELGLNPGEVEGDGFGAFAVDLGVGQPG